METKELREKQPTHLEIDRSIYDIARAVEKFETVLSRYLGEPAVTEEKCEERSEPTVAEVYGSTAGRIENCAKNLYGQIERLEQLFS